MQSANHQSGVAVLIKIKAQFSIYCAARPKALQPSRLSVAAWLRDKQYPPIMNQTLKGVRSHIQSRSVERVFASYHCLGTFAGMSVDDTSILRFRCFLFHPETVCSRRLPSSIDHEFTERNGAASNFREYQSEPSHSRAECPIGASGYPLRQPCTRSNR
jgi:hypothetical protein